MSLSLLPTPPRFALSGGRKFSIPRLSLRNVFVPTDGRVALFILTRVGAPAALGAMLLHSALPLVLGAQVAAFVLVQHFGPRSPAAGLDRILLHLYQLLFGVLVVLGAVVAGMEPQAAMGAAICGLALAIVPLVVGVALGERADEEDDSEGKVEEVAPTPRTGLATRLVFTRAPSDTYPGGYERGAEEV
ncbi:hypothetical protein Q8F55_001815 [Vanrija albida]|uniref:TRP C-terminal domain-containing protein n=1 Tax=Vanrija albida TaxID=181172 RepID=A0ABR3Q8R4_9TREE